MARAKTRSRQRYIGKHRPFPDWLRKVDWPIDRLDFKTNVPAQVASEVARRLLAYIIFPPPILAGPGGRSAKDTQVKGKARKHTQLSQSERKTYEQLKTFIAVELAERLASYERLGAHRNASAASYNSALHDFRVIGGFTRILSKDGVDLALYTMDKSKWTAILGAVCVFDILASGGYGHKSHEGCTQRKSCLSC